MMVTNNLTGDVIMVNLKNRVGLIKQAKVGFSFTTLFFGCFVPFIRGDLKWGVIQLALTFLANCVIPFAGTLGVSLVFGAIYNELYIKELLMSGFEPASEKDREILVQHGFIVDEKTTE